MSALFSPLKIRNAELSNRIVVSPMCTYAAHDGLAQDWHKVHLGSLAMSGAALLIVEATAVEPAGRITPGCLGLWDERCEAAFADLLRVVRPLSKAHICLQIGHAGRKASSALPWERGQLLAMDAGGWTTVAPSAIPQRDDERSPRALTIAEMVAIKERFVAAAQRAARLDFDAIELHAAHGYLLHQFLSPLANQRADQYGGSLENRMRFPLEVLAAVRATWPSERPLGMRISASDWRPDLPPGESWDLPDAIEFTKRAAELGLDWIDVSSGGVSQHQKIDLKPGYQVHFAAAIKAAVSIPVMSVGLITEPRQAEAIVANGQADLIALARALLFNPHWPWLAAAELGASVSVPPQYWRSAPHNLPNPFGPIVQGGR
jgi:2,4-dienoyl-CoA reductase-like NADH-dependent reductase (Old Yellow Enzyme family)